MTDSLEKHLAWIRETCGTEECACRYEWRGLGRLYGTSFGKGWVRMTTEPGCLEHGEAAAATRAARSRR